MDINKILEPFDNLLKSINENKILLILVLVLLGIYYTYNSNNIVEHSIFLFDNEIFKFTLFILITYISSSNPAIGIGLAIIMLVSLQIITYLKLKKEFDIDIKKIESEIDYEKFSQIEPADISYLDDEYLTNPLTKINQLAPPLNFNLKFTTPTDLSYQMINQGKTLLNDSLDLEKDLENRYDSREQQIAYETKRNGTELVDSGINRLQKADQGEYNYLKNNSKNLNFKSNTSNKFLKYSKLNNNNLSNPLINASFSQLEHNYDLLVNNNLNPKEFDLQLEKVYMSEFDLLQSIYKSNKKNYSIQKQNIIESTINNISNLSKQDKNNLFLKLEQLYLEMR